MGSYKLLLIAAVGLGSLTGATPLSNVDSQTQVAVPVFVRDDAASPAPNTCKPQKGDIPPSPIMLNGRAPNRGEVELSINAWLNDVCVVDEFLNGGDLPLTSAKLDKVIAYASDEPNQLAILLAVGGLSQIGQKAGARLMTNFPPVVDNLNDYKAGKIDLSSCLISVNALRCCTVLPALSFLIKEACTASAAFQGMPIPAPVYPQACARLDCSKWATF